MGSALVEMKIVRITPTQKKKKSLDAPARFMSSLNDVGGFRGSFDSSGEQLRWRSIPAPNAYRRKRRAGFNSTNVGQGSVNCEQMDGAYVYWVQLATSPGLM